MAKDKKQNIAGTVAQLVAPLVETHGLTLWDTRFEKEGSDWFLRVYVDREGGLDMNGCEAFSRDVSALLDERDPIDGGYYLEVGTPGVDAKLVKPHHFEQSIGQIVELRLIRPHDGVRDRTGELVAYDDGVVTIRNEDGTFQYPKADTAYIKLYFDYELERKQ